MTLSTILPALELYGSQQPRVLTRPDFHTEASGAEAVDFARSFGCTLAPWQELCVRVALAERADGKYAATEVAELVARQNGKGVPWEVVVLHGMFLVGDPLTLWTAHQFKTSAEAFLRIRAWIDGSDSLRRRVKSISTSHGEESVTLLGPNGNRVIPGPRLRFLARSKASGRGFSPQRIVWDEAQELSKVSFEALNMSSRAQPNRQSLYAGTVPGPEINHPQHWTRVRDRGRAGTSPRLAWLEWSPDGSDDPVTAQSIDLDDPQVMADGNPALGYRLTLETLQDDRDAMEPDSYGREALSIWPSLTTADAGIFGPDWRACALPPDFTGDLPPVTAIGLAADVDQAYGTIGSAASWPDGRVQLDAVDRRRGVTWLIAEAKRMQDEHGVVVALDEHGPLADLVEPLEAAGVALTKGGTDEYLDSCATVAREVQEHRVTHNRTTDLDAAVQGAVWRDVGDRRAWGRRKSTSSVAMLESVTWAHHAVDAGGFNIW